MVSAKLTYRNRVPHNYYAFTTSHLHFNGETDVTAILRKLKNLVEFDKAAKNEKEIEKLSKLKQSNHIEWQNWLKEIKCFEKTNLFWMLSKRLRQRRSALKSERDRLVANDESLSLEISKLDKNRFYNASELTHKFKNLLTQLGFTCKALTTNDSNLHEEIYESTCSDEELIVKAKNMIAKLQQTEKKNLLSE